MRPVKPWPIGPGLRRLGCHANGEEQNRRAGLPLGGGNPARCNDSTILLQYENQQYEN